MPHISKVRPNDVQPEQHEVDPTRVLGGDPKQAAKVVWRSPDGTVAVGLFRSTKGKFTAKQLCDESTPVLKGRVIVTAEYGASVECRPGEIMTIPRASTCTFEVLEDLEDCFAVSNPDGVAL